MKTRLLLFLASMLAFKASINAQVSVSSFTPVSGAAGIPVIISGSGFNTTAADNTVFFGAVKASVTTASPTSLTVTVPAGVSYAPITVINTGTNLSAMSNGRFTPTYTGPSTIYNGHFVIQPPIPVTGTVQGGASLADMDGDGKVDVVFSARFGNKVSIMRNTGSPGTFSFAAQADFPTQYDEPWTVSLADLDVDGKLDMIAPGGNLSTQGVSFFRNTSTSGNLSFTTSGFVMTQGNIAASGDFDGDGKPDVVLRGSGNNLSIYRNTSSGPGNISFAAPVSTGTNSWYGTKPSVADIDGDGKPDIVSGYGTNLVILKNTTIASGNITFADPESFASFANVFYTALGDFNNDGKIDVATIRGYGSTNNKISFFENTSAGATISFTRTDVSTPEPTDISVTDFNGDGKADIFVSTTSVSTGPNHHIIVHQNTTTGSAISFGSNINIGGVNSTQLLYFSTAGDVDGDGKPEAIAFDANMRIYTMTGVFPVQLTSFTASLVDNLVKLEWSTAEESGIELYEVQRSLDGKNFSTINSKKANNKDNSKYTLVDESPQKGTNWYRLYIRSKDNDNKYSGIVTVKITGKGDGIRAFPNPVLGNKLNLQINAEKGDYTVRLVNSTGKTVWNDIIRHKGGSSVEVFNLPTVPKGIYIVQVNGNDVQFSQNIIF